MILLPFLTGISIHLLTCQGATPPSAHIIVDGSIESLVLNFDTPSECTVDTESVGLEENYHGANIGVGCCNDDVPPVGTRPDCLIPATYEEALAHCQSRVPPLRLCTEAEILAGAGDSKGCAFDHFHLWTSTECVASHYTANALIIPDECRFDFETESISLVVNDINIGVTCCDNGTITTGSRPGCLSGVTYGEAFRHCQDQVPSLRLCTMAEIAAGAGTEEGCEFDGRHNWVSDVCVATYSPTADPTLHTPSPSLAPSFAPIQPPPTAPTQPPSSAPTQPPSLAPTQPPSQAPTQPPSLAPTQPPSQSPTQPPSHAPTQPPSQAPTQPPSLAPTQPPSQAPTQPPTIAPSLAPTQSPSLAPTQPPSLAPTQPPSLAPTQPPSHSPTQPPTTAPTQPPNQSLNPTLNPSLNPSLNPTLNPSLNPTSNPSLNPTFMPTIHPTAEPTPYPTVYPTSDPTHHPTENPTAQPTLYPTLHPTVHPTVHPTFDPTFPPSFHPTADPTNDPTTDPTIDPIPSTNPTNAPTAPTTVSPSMASNNPSMNPTNMLSNAPSKSPTNMPSIIPSIYPNASPTMSPTQWYDNLHFICHYKDNKAFISNFLSLRQYSEIMLQTILETIQIIGYQSINYHNAPFNALTPWKKAAVFNFVICNVFNTELIINNYNIDCPSYFHSDLQENEEHNEYIAIGVFGIVANNAVQKYKKEIIDIMEADEFKDKCVKIMNNKINNNTQTRRMLLEYIYNSFEIIDIDIIDPLNYTMSTTNIVDDDDDEQFKNKQNTAIIIGVVIGFLFLIFFIVIFYLKSQKQNKNIAVEGANDRNEIAMVEKENDLEEGAEGIILQPVYKDDDIIKAVNRTVIDDDMNHK